MATQHLDLTSDSVTDVTTGLSLASGSDYTLQCQAGSVRMAEASSEPDLDADPSAVILNPGFFFPYQQGSDNLYAWGNARLVVFDAV